MGETTAASGAVTARYAETETERLLVFERVDGEPTVGATIAQNREGYAMLSVRHDGPDGAEVERYYGLEMAVDHVAELLGVDAGEVPIPAAGRDMGM